ncbi:unnamed protein product [Microthlaspi erraticum]|uniref:Uncharacterized protein n=1 Tax=Microthlaspi erraticum TaxID=1685480 RepID=A0A6D2K152_9BRAS|nr:unnamed protein product [Microthlaspi erraticum]
MSSSVICVTGSHAQISSTSSSVICVTVPCLALFLSTGGFSIKFQNSSTTPIPHPFSPLPFEKISYLLHLYRSLPPELRHVDMFVKVHDALSLGTSSFSILLLLLLFFG